MHILTISNFFFYSSLDWYSTRKPIQAALMQQPYYRKQAVVKVQSIQVLEVGA